MRALLSVFLATIVGPFALLVGATATFTENADEPGSSCVRLVDGAVQPTPCTNSYIVEPLPEPLNIALLLLGALITALAAKRLLAMRRIEPKPAWTPALVLSAFSGLLLGVVWNAATYGTEDANIGGGIAIIFGLPIAGFLALCGLAVAIKSQRDSNKTATAS